VANRLAIRVTSNLFMVMSSVHFMFPRFLGA
jgi:hypothetical protein